MPARYADPFGGSGYPTNPAWALAGASLARALFGDPQARAQQELRQAQTGQAEAAARENDAQALLYGQQFKARGNLAQAVEGLAPITAPSPTVDPSNVIAVPPGLEGVARVIAEALPSETGGPAPALVSPGVGPAAVASAGPEHFSTASLAALAQRLSEAGQLGEAGDLARLIAAHAGGDELARRGVVGAGGSPGEWFAITPERRDQIAAQADEAAMARARLAAETAVRGQNVRADTEERGQDARDRTQRRGQNMTNDTQRTDPRRTTGGAVTPGRVIGSIMDKMANGEELTFEEQQLYEDYRTNRAQNRNSRRARGSASPVDAAFDVADRITAAARAAGRRDSGSSGRTVPEGTIQQNRATGARKVMRGGRWVPLP